MRRSTKLVIALVLLAAAGVASTLLVVDYRSKLRAKDFEKIIAMRSDEPQIGLASDWLECLKRQKEGGGSRATRTICKASTTNGLTSELVALKVDDQIVPVIENRLAGAKPGPVIVDIIGGPGGKPFAVDDAPTDKQIAEMREAGFTINGIDWHASYVSLLERGFTIASVGYWGTGLRTLNAPDEMQLAIREVRTVIDHYRDRDGAEPALLTTSLGNHLALGAMGEKRLEAMNFLALVPVMDGLQHHLRRAEREMAEARNKAKASGEPYGKWTFFHLYKETKGGKDFDHVRMLPLHDFFPLYAGAADFPWGAVGPIGPCSRIILGSKDPRTRDYLAARDDLPQFVTVLASDHDLFADAPQEMRAIFDRYADCLEAH
ncbi:alpha/beta fold hydrolase [Porphyrobacter sp. AAP60]|uniref:alpha/beta fold hydrolase n=1 Tax=Porphyrobacter sp. AAP60 TaxID=1523423 RepID=UPI0006B95EAB|nr:alpha/beta fold hydrolase [Porphyrobacter sp. AAP60]KPF61834.1 hypothetical protein IP79_14580 [Porphyrobacter sp. AAP60]